MAYVFLGFLPVFLSLNRQVQGSPQPPKPWARDPERKDVHDADDGRKTKTARTTTQPDMPQQPQEPYYLKPLIVL